jgi:hypothetical protein
MMQTSRTPQMMSITATWAVAFANCHDSQSIPPWCRTGGRAASREYPPGLRLRPGGE